MIATKILFRFFNKAIDFKCPQLNGLLNEYYYYSVVLLYRSIRRCSKCKKASNAARVD